METILLIFFVAVIICIAIITCYYLIRCNILRDEIDALTEELANVAEQKSELFKKTEEQSATIAARKRKIDTLTADSQQYFGLNKSLERKVADLNKEVAQKNDKITELDAKYRAVVQHQQNIQEAYDELSKKYDELKAEYDKSKECRVQLVTISQTEESDIKFRAATKAECNTARTIGFKQSPKSEQPRGKDGKFGKKHKRDDDPRK